MRQFTSLHLSVALTAVTLATPALAREGSGRVLGGHAFIESESLESPFITTSIATLTGAGLASADLDVDLDNDGAPDALALSLGVFRQGFLLGIAPTEWLELRAAMAGLVFSGSNVDTALILGVTAAYDYVVGAQVRLLQTSALQVSASLDVDVNNGLRFSPLQAIQESIDKGQISRDSLLAKTATTELKPSVQVAYGLNTTLGVWAAATYEHALKATDGDVEPTTGAGLGVSADFSPEYDFPLGVVLAGTVSSSGETSSRSGSAGLCYTGRPALQTGVEVETGTQSSPSSSLEFTAGLFKLRYYW